MDTVRTPYHAALSPSPPFLMQHPSTCPHSIIHAQSLLFTQLSPPHPSPFSSPRAKAHHKNNILVIVDHIYSCKVKSALYTAREPLDRARTRRAMLIHHPFVRERVFCAEKS